MSDMRVSVIPVARMDVGEVEEAANRVARVLGSPILLREAAPVPRGTENFERRQHDASAFLADLRGKMAPLRVVKVIGGDESAANVPMSSMSATVFVTDLDLYTEKSDGVFAYLSPKFKVGVVSVRRLKEAFHRRKADPAKQRTRLMKEMLRVIARVSGMPKCANPACPISPSKVLPDIDSKEERYCPPCWTRMSTGVSRI